MSKCRTPVCGGICICAQFPYHNGQSCEGKVFALFVQEIEFAKTMALQLCLGMEGVTPILDRPPDSVPFNILPLGSHRQIRKKYTAPAGEEENEETRTNSSSEQQAESSDGTSLESEVDAGGSLSVPGVACSSTSSCIDSTATTTSGCNGNSLTAASLVEDLTKKVWRCARVFRSVKFMPSRWSGICKFLLSLWLDVMLQHGDISNLSRRILS